MKYIILIGSILFSAFMTAQDYPKVIPDFEIFTIEGQSFTSKDVQNENYSFFIYFNPECGHCKTAFEALNLKVEDLKKANVTLYPVSANTKEKTTTFFEELAPEIYDLRQTNVLIDDNFKFADKFFVGGYPTSYLYDKNKKLIKVYNGTTETVSFMEDLE
jgi:peroxiredoxin